MAEGCQKNPQLPSSNSQLLFFCRPALAHQANQMLQGFLVSTAFFSGKLAGALVELRGHFGGFFRRTAKRDENPGKL